MNFDTEELDSEVDPVTVKAIQSVGGQMQQSDNPKYNFKAMI